MCLYILLDEELQRHPCTVPPLVVVICFCMGLLLVHHTGTVLRNQYDMSQDKKADELHVSSSRDSRVCRIYRQYSQTREIDFKLRRRAVNDIMIMPGMNMETE